MRTPTIAVTAGDPSGIGPEVLEQLLAQRAGCGVDIRVVASAEEFAAVGAVGLPGVSRQQDVPSQRPQSWEPRATAEAGAHALDRLERAVTLAARGDVQGILFAPLNKHALKLAGMTQEDELRWLADAFGTTAFTSEVNVLEELMTARVTSHVPLGDVAGLVTEERIRAAAHLIATLLRASGKPRPRIAVAALNPHGGDGGTLGHEEIDVITPAVVSLRADGLEVSGPFPADTLFATQRDELDGVVTMFHDQGQIALKLLGFDRGVTLEAGLPVPVVTPAHGTAHDIVGTRQANASATLAAFDLLHRMLTNA